MKLFENSDCLISHIESQNRLIIYGILRLRTILDYETIIGRMFGILSASELPLNIDISSLKSLNSSGLAAMGVFFIRAKNDYPLKKLIITASSDIHWQKIHIDDFKNISRQIEIQFIALQ